MTAEVQTQEITEEEDPRYNKKTVIGERIMKLRKSKSGKTIFRKVRIGDLVALRVGDQVSIGWSLCHKKDSYDFVDGDHDQGFGRRTAINRALKRMGDAIIIVPPSIFKKTVQFAKRCQKYYKGMEIPLIDEMIVDYPDQKE